MIQLTFHDPSGTGSARGDRLQNQESRAVPSGTGREAVEHSLVELLAEFRGLEILEPMYRIGLHDRIERLRSLCT